MKILNLISIAVCLVVLCGLGCSRSETTKAQAMEMFDKAGGVDKVNQEAKVIFDRFGTDESITIYGPSLTNFPAISSLGSSVFLQNKNNPPAGQHILKYLSAVITKGALSLFSTLRIPLSFHMLQDALRWKPIFLLENER